MANVADLLARVVLGGGVILAATWALPEVPGFREFHFSLPWIGLRWLVMAASVGLALLTLLTS